MKHALCSLFIGFSALAVSLAIPQDTQAYSYCDYYTGCYHADGPDLYASEYEYSYSSYNTAYPTYSTYDSYCGSYYYDCDYDNTYYYSGTSVSPSINLSFSYTEHAAPTYSYPTYPVYYQTPVPVPVYVPTPVTKTVYTPAPVKTTAKKTKKKNDTFYVYASASF